MEPRNRFQGINSASLCSLAGLYDNPIPTRFLAPIDCLKIPAQSPQSWQPYGGKQLVFKTVHWDFSEINHCLFLFFFGKSRLKPSTILGHLFRTTVSGHSIFCRLCWWIHKRQGMEESGEQCTVVFAWIGTELASGRGGCCSPRPPTCLFSLGHYQTKKSILDIYK